MLLIIRAKLEARGSGIKFTAWKRVPGQRWCWPDGGPTVGDWLAPQIDARLRDGQDAAYAAVRRHRILDAVREPR